MALRFEIAELRREITAFEALAAPFLTASAGSILKQVSSSLDSISRRQIVGADSVKWQVATDRPVSSVPSCGAYMPDENGALTVRADMSFVWDVAPVRGKAPSRRPASQLELKGRASTLVRIFDVGGGRGQREREIAAWRMEVADDASPGSYFHIQVLGREGDEVFPKDLDIPRLPGMLASPFACMEFVLAELFQDAWSKRAVGNLSSASVWRGIQEYRQTQQLLWHLDSIKGNSGTPWVAWKKSQPPEELFIRKKQK